MWQNYLVELLKYNLFKQKDEDSWQCQVQVVNEVPVGGPHMQVGGDEGGWEFIWVGTALDSTSRRVEQILEVNKTQ